MVEKYVSRMVDVKIRILVFRFPTAVGRYSFCKFPSYSFEIIHNMGTNDEVVYFIKRVVVQFSIGGGTPRNHQSIYIIYKTTISIQTYHGTTSRNLH